MAKSTAKQIEEALEAYKKQVLEVARRVKEDESWCDEGFREVMDELGIDVGGGTFSVTVPILQTFYLEVEEMSLEEVERHVRDVFGLPSNLSLRVRDDHDGAEWTDYDTDIDLDAVKIEQVAD